MSQADDWRRYGERLWGDDELGLRLDLSRIGGETGVPGELTPRLAAALRFMAELEGGAVANPDENRQVGHYWLRDPDRAPAQEQTEAIRATHARIRVFTREVHAGRIRPPCQGVDRFTRLLVVGIGGSALGPQFLAQSLGGPRDAMTAHFIDNTDPDGIDTLVQELDEDLRRTLVVVVSKSGGTRETRNGMFEIEAAFAGQALEFPRHAVAVTGAGSLLDEFAREQGFLDVFPMWDWVGGRTSVTSAVGLLPAALQGVDTEEFLAGARDMDARTRDGDPSQNPAALLAAVWHHATDGKARRAMVVLPYKDRLILFSRYLQQLVMESLGKGTDLDGEPVSQGLTVYGNKGSTDQHAYVQQLRDGPDDFFATFIAVDRDRDGASLLVEENVTSGDYLLGFLLGTREALHAAGRESITLELIEVSPRTVGALIALYERAVGIYAHLININAYHQPGVEAGKKAAAAVLALQRSALETLRSDHEQSWTADALAAKLGSEDAETLYHVLVHAAANPDHGVVREPSDAPAEVRFRAKSG